MIWREATRADVPAVVALLADDMLGHGRESAGVAPYLAPSTPCRTKAATG